MKIEPALTAEEWEVPGVGRADLNAWHEGDELTVGEMSTRNAAGVPYLAFTVEGADRHALAALALYGQPFGFTREDVRILRVAAEAYDEDPFYFRTLEPDEDVDESPVPGMYRALADRIESLLPPEK